MHIDAWVHNNTDLHDTNVPSWSNGSQSHQIKINKSERYLIKCKAHHLPGTKSQSKAQRPRQTAGRAQEEQTAKRGRPAGAP